MVILRTSWRYTGISADGDEAIWSSTAYSKFWEERVTIRRRMGCSPYFAATGTHPLLPFDIAEANYLLPPQDSTLTSADLISRRAIALQKRTSPLATLHHKVYSARLKAAARFEREHAHSIRDFNSKLGDLVLVCNTAIEKAETEKIQVLLLNWVNTFSGGGKRGTNRRGISFWVNHSKLIQT
jgi:hypothetical protein